MSETNLAREILSNLMETKNIEESKQFLAIFSLSEQQNILIVDFVKNNLKLAFSSSEKDSYDDQEGQLNEASESESSANDSYNETEEYFDSASDD